jgi:hypothetical protein
MGAPRLPLQSRSRVAAFGAGLLLLAAQEALADRTAPSTGSATIVIFGQ